jgi:2-keto-4-pentenoate hydratase/2-oxohepta-3-ene-1,7-dioic acid hydratase in catechol pathway
MADGMPLSRGIQKRLFSLVRRMKLATFALAGRTKIGIVHGGDSRVFDLVRASQLYGRIDRDFESMLSLIDSGPRGLDKARRLFEGRAQEQNLSISLSEVQLLAPVPEPRQMRDAMTFPDHIRQAPAGMLRLAARLRGEEPSTSIQPLDEVPVLHRQQPIFYFTNRLNVRGPGAVVHWPCYSRIMDFELEFGVFLSRRGVNIPVRRAREHIFGFTIFNDFSARDAQLIEMQGNMGPTKAKSFDGANIIGPWIVTADEIPDPYSLAMTARVNGQTWTSGDSSSMLHSFEDMIAYISRDETLFAGEFIGSGTMGSGCGLELDRYLKHGDEIELQVDRIGVLRNTVVAHAEK